MKKLFILFPLLFIFTTLQAQKQVIDSSVYGKWTSVGGGTISNNGKYIFHSISNQPVGSSTLILKAIDNQWKLEMPNCSGLSFSTDSKKLIVYKKEGLAIVTLGSNKIEDIPGVSSYKFSATGCAEWLAYQLANTTDMVLRNLNTNQQKIMKEVKDYSFSETGKTLLYQTDKGNATKTLNWMNLSAGTNNVQIWSGAQSNMLIFDDLHEQVAFTSIDTLRHQLETSIWYYRAGMQKAECLIDTNSITRNNGVGFFKFSKDGSQLFVKLEKKLKNDPVKSNSTPIIWSYQDIKLHTEKNVQESIENYYCAIDLNTHRYRRIFNANEAMFGSSFLIPRRWDDIGLIAHLDQDIDREEGYWIKGGKTTEYIVNTKTGSRKAITEFVGLEKSGFEISPDKHYVVYYDGLQRDYCSYEIATGATRNITQHIATDWSVFADDHPESRYFHYDNYGWLAETSLVILCDQNDIWLIDMKGQHAPVNLTNGYGKKHNILFRIAFNGELSVAHGQKLILCALNRGNKDNGFYQVVVGKGQDPKMFTMGPYIYDLPDNGLGQMGHFPVKAKDAEVYLVQRMSAEEAPNYFYTKDFKTFTRLSDVHPEKNYNWLTTELVKWQLRDGSQSQGILYKPENFDPAKKYPVIFYYYERLSDHLHDYLEPDFALGRMDIPTYVSNGYMVFTPDIYYTIGYPFLSAYSTVESAAAYLSKMPYVDSMRMGLQGHSFGACQTGYIITHSHRFAAACAASGIYNMASIYGSVLEKNSGPSAQSWVENSQGRIGTTLWDRPDLFIENSAVFGADRVATPLLMMATTDDGVSAFNNQLEFFMGLRRMGKKTWMLQYPGNHMVSGDYSRDYTKRMQQFFDHYLKGTAVPEWMLNGGDSLKLAPAGVTPGPGLLNEAEQKKVDSLLTRKPVIVTVN